MWNKLVNRFISITTIDVISALLIPVNALITPFIVYGDGLSTAIRTLTQCIGVGAIQSQTRCMVDAQGVFWAIIEPFGTLIYRCAEVPPEAIEARFTCTTISPRLVGADRVVYAGIGILI
jgi:hypothetical protein